MKFAKRGVKQHSMVALIERFQRIHINGVHCAILLKYRVPPIINKDFDGLYLSVISKKKYCTHKSI